MSKPPRQKIGLPLSPEDQALVDQTARASGLGASARRDKSPPSLDAPEPKSMVARPDPAAARSVAKQKLKSQDLRSYIRPGSDLAAALADALDSLDPKARDFVAPSSVLRRFFHDHDVALAVMFRENNALK